ncbi:SH3 domain-containing protein [Dokdonella immobilis]|uniref:SH3 domain-containing protein n=1 Tax=Dokdonella immobilis TaxID=578942 RepID=A0A1I4ZVU5_9GAMM|nr:SH3 domain-containing protein [Dokdonella immobilis]SFN54385.1 SH3 domain-containing protein [Dokdonella immobilis]
MKRIQLVLMGLCLFALAPLAHAIIGVDVNEDIDSVLAGRAPPLHLPDAKYRIAVFEFEDPDGTGLGSAVSTLIAREVLLRSGLGSLGVLNYYGSLAPTRKHPQSYFDKVDLVVRAQQASLAIWGVVRRDESSILIDVQAQLPDPVVARSYAWELKLPQAMGGETLHARISPTRLQVQHVRMPREFATTLAAMASAGNVVRAAPSRSAAISARIPKYSAMTVTETRGGWSKFVVDGRAGWVQGATDCTRECAQLLGTASFVGALLKFGDGGPAPTPSKDLARDTLVVARQLAVLADLRGRTFRPAEVYLARWDGAKASDFGAPYADFLALSTLADAFKQQGERPYDAIRLDDVVVRRVATALAQASQDDPRNTEVLDNLAVLFRVLGDERRASLARRLSSEVQDTRKAEPTQ